MQAITRSFFMVILLLVASVTASNAQDTPKTDLKKIIQEIAINNTYESAHVGFAGIKSTQYTRFEKMLSAAGDYELIALTYDTNAVVRLYALQALHHKGITIPENMKKRFAEDKTQVGTLQGCLFGNRSVQLLALSILQQPIPASNAFNTKQKTAQ